MMRKPIVHGCRILIAAFGSLGVVAPSLAQMPMYPTFQLQVRSNFCVNGPGFNLPCSHFFANATPAMNDQRQVAIKLDAIPGGNEGFQGMWFGQNAAGSIVYTSPDGAFLSDPTMNNLGYVVFPQSFSSQNGIRFYDSATNMNGLRTTLPLGASTWGAPKVNDAGLLGYRAGFSGSGQAHVSLQGTLSSGVAVHAVEAGVDPQSDVSFLFTPNFNNHRQIASVVRLGAAGQTGNSQPDQVRIYNSDGSFIIVARDRDSDPTSQFTSFDSTKPGFNDNGEVAFAANLFGGGRGVFRVDSQGNVTTIATTLRGQVTVIDSFGPAINDNGLVAFRGRDNTMPTTRHAIFVGDGVTLRRVIGQFDHVPTDLGIAQIARNDSNTPFGGSISMNSRGDIAFHCQLKPTHTTAIEWGSGIFIAIANTTPADINHDGAVGVPDLLAVISAWGPCQAWPATCLADVAPGGGDGAVGVPDLLTIIANWGVVP